MAKSLTLSLADLMDMFIENRVQIMREEMHQFLDSLGVDLEYDPDMQGIDFEQIEDYLKEQDGTE